MKQNINKKQKSELEKHYSNRQARGHINQETNSKEKSNSSLNKSKSNLKMRTSRMQTNQSKHLTTNQSEHKKLSKRIKTEGKNSDILSTNEKSPTKHQSSVVTRIKTDLSQRRQSPNFQHPFDDDHHNNVGSLVGLLEFHREHRGHHDHDPDEQQFNVIVRRQTQGSKLSKTDEDKQSQKQSAEYDTNKKKGDKRKQSDERQNDDQDEQQQQDEEKSSQKKSKPSKSSYQHQEKGKKTKRSKITLLQSQRPSGISQYSLGTAALIGMGQQPNFKKKPKIRSYSHEQKLKIMSQNKYVPKNESQLRMEKRYLKGQIITLNEKRETEQMLTLMAEYRNNKRLIFQQSMKKIQLSKMIENMKNKSKQLEKNNSINVKRAMSVPKLKTYNQFVLPTPNQMHKIQSPQQIQLQKINHDCTLIEGSLSANRFHYLQKNQCAMKKNLKKEDIHAEAQQIQYVQNVLRSKGVKFDPNTIRKGLVSMKTMPDLDQNIRLEVPKNLVSNPRYQKYPL